MRRMFLFFFFNDTATTEIYTLSLHDALPIFLVDVDAETRHLFLGDALGAQLAQHLAAFHHHRAVLARDAHETLRDRQAERSEEHTSELQSRQYLVCRLLLEKKKLRLLWRVAF